MSQKSTSVPASQVDVTLHSL